MSHFRLITDNTLEKISAYKKVAESEIIVLHDTGREFQQGPLEIDNYHIGKGWQGIGYDVYIDKKNAYETFRFWGNVPGAHCTKRNHDSIGICLCGETKFSDDQYAHLCTIIEAILRGNSNLLIYYHKELSEIRRDPHASLCARIEKDYGLWRPK